MNVGGAVQDLLDTVSWYRFRGSLAAHRNRPATNLIVKQVIGSLVVSGKLNHFCAEAVARFMVSSESLVVLSRDAMQTIRCEGELLKPGSTTTGVNCGELSCVASTGSVCVVACSGGIATYTPKLQFIRSFKLPGHSNNVLSITVTPGGKYVATGNANATVAVWSTDGGLMHTLSGHTDWVRFVSFAKPGKRCLHLYSASDDGTIALWDALAGTILGRLDYSHGQSIQVFVVSWNSEMMAIACDSPTISVYKTVSPLSAADETSVGGDARFGPPVVPLQSGTRSPSSSRDGFSSDGIFRIERIGSDVVAHKSTPTTVKFSDDSQWVVSAGEDELLAITSIGEPRQTFVCDVFMITRNCISFMNTVTALCVLASPPKSSVFIVAACASDGTVVQWVVDPRNGRSSFTKKIQLHIGALISMDRVNSNMEW